MKLQKVLRLALICLVTAPPLQAAQQALSQVDIYNGSECAQTTDVFEPGTFNFVCPGGRAYTAGNFPSMGQGVGVAFVSVSEGASGAATLYYYFTIQGPSFPASVDMSVSVFASGGAGEAEASVTTPIPFGAPPHLQATTTGGASGDSASVSVLNSGVEYQVELRATCPFGPCTAIADPIFDLPEGYSVRFSDNLPLDPSPLVSSILPSGRSVQVGEAATAFATIINSGSETGTNCGIFPRTPVPGAFSFQTTDAQNLPTGTADTGVDIPGGGLQSYVFGFTPDAPLSPADVELFFECDNLIGADLTLGLNTLLLSASATPIPDIVALAATPTNDGIVSLTASGAFAVATVNVGTTGSITATADTSAASVPVVMSICETDANTGACLSPPADAATGVTKAITDSATPTFSIFATATENIALDAANNRIFVRFTDDTGAVRGATSVAVRATLP